MKRILPLLVLMACQGPKDAVNTIETTPPNKFSDSTIVKIYDLKDRRNAIELVPYLTMNQNDYKLEALMAFASIQDSTVLPDLYPLLQDESTDIRKACAFVIGQTKSTSSTEPLMRSIEQEREVEVIAQMLIALGKCANDEALATLINYQTEDPALIEAKAWGIYRAGLKGVKSNLGSETIVGLMAHDSVSVRWSGSNYLGRIAGNELNEHIELLIQLMVSEEDPLVKMNLVRSLGKIESKSAQDAILKELSIDQDYRVSINILRGLNKIEKKDLELMRQCAQGGHPQLAIPIAQLIARSEFSGELLQRWPDQMENAAASSILFKRLLKESNSEELVQSVMNRINESKNVYDKGEFIKALGYNEQHLDYLIERALSSEHAYIKTAAMGAILEMLSSTSNSSKYMDVLKKAIVSGDVGLLPMAASALVSPEHNFKSKYKDFEFLYEAKKSLQLPKDAEALIGLQSVIDFFEGNETVTSVTNPFNNPIDWDRVKTIPKDQRATIFTRKGPIVVQLFVEDAPGTVEFITRLIEQGFYEGLTFHRLVPNFVAQGGCPRGDGYGGTPESIRSEFGYSGYETGTLGMASAGKDTESCQFFITHRPTPHLEGSYTVFGRVVENMVVVEQLGLGQEIFSVVLD